MNKLALFKIGSLLAALLLGIFFLSINGTAAQGVNQEATQESIQSQTLTLSPFIFEERMEKGQTIRRQIELTNHSSEPLQISAAINDFAPAGTDGQPIFLPEGQGGDSQYSLSSWMKIITPPPAILPGGRTVEVTVSVSVPPNAEEGSLYSGVLFSYGGLEPNNTGSQIIKKTGTLFFVRVGRANEQGGITNFSSDKHLYTDAAVNFITQFSNTGNVHLKPKGNIHLYNMWGRLVAAVPINRDALIVLPGRQRTFGSNWQSQWAFGYYGAEADVYYGDNKFEARAQTSFWILPIKGIILLLLLLVILIALLWKGIKIYNARILKRAGISPDKIRKKNSQ